MVLARLLLFVALWHTAEGGFAVGVEAAFFLLNGVLARCLGRGVCRWRRRRRSRREQQQYLFRLSSSSG